MQNWAANRHTLTQNEENIFIIFIFIFTFATFCFLGCWCHTSSYLRLAVKRNEINVCFVRCVRTSCSCTILYCITCQFLYGIRRVSFSIDQKINRYNRYLVRPFDTKQLCIVLPVHCDIVFHSRMRA